MPGIELKGFKGLGELLKNTKNNNSTEEVFLLPINQLKPSVFQPRTVFNDKSIQNLVSSIKENGIIQPIIVREAKIEYEIIAGERRWRAAQILGLETIPALIRNVSNDVSAVFALVENVQREDLNPIDQATALLKLATEYLMTHQDIAKIVGISRSAVTNYIRMLSLDEHVQILLKEGKLETGHAKVILSLDSAQQVRVSNKIIEENLSVRETEELVRKVKYKLTKIDSCSNEQEIEIKEWNKKFTEIFLKKVEVFLKKNGKGYIKIKIEHRNEIKWLLEHLKTE